MNEPFTYEYLSDFGAVLRLRRKAMGLTMVQVSEYAGIGRNHYSRIEAGILSPRTAFLSIFRILNALKLYWTIEIRDIPDATRVPIHLDKSNEIHYSGTEPTEEELDKLLASVLNRSKEAQ